MKFCVVMICEDEEKIKQEEFINWLQNTKKDVMEKFPRAKNKVFIIAL